eukprot:GHVS01074009.1.p2 GENE.GHVS01074009.1~~GHVS01074009.1.p2  ORF type:complete len:130 (+),score=17.62 GHVS01074009.1:166-555(+)
MESPDNQFFKHRPSTKIHVAPGGTSSIVFGDGSAREREAPPHCNTRGPHPPQSDVRERKTTCSDHVVEHSQKRMMKPDMVSHQEDRQNHPGGNGGFTRAGAAGTYDHTAPRSSVRIRQPPGGNSTFSLS